ncbi:MAG: OmpA family protein [Bacteroidetes bacterium]|nr:OmpA family protein [Bacteroidota bacterium]
MSTVTAVPQSPVVVTEVIVSGVVVNFDNNKPIKAKIVVKRLHTQEDVAVTYSDPNTGSYFVALEPGDYDMIVESKAYHYFTEKLKLDQASPRKIKKHISLTPITSLINFVTDDFKHPINKNSDGVVITADDLTAQGSIYVINDVEYENVTAGEDNQNTGTDSNGTGQVEPDRVENPIVVNIPALPNQDLEYEVIRIKIMEGHEYIDLKMVFTANSSSLNDLTETELDKIILFLKQNVGLNMEIRGYGDYETGDNQMYQLGLMRAQVSARYIMLGGISAKRLKVTVKKDMVDLSVNKPKKIWRSLHLIEFILNRDKDIILADNSSFKSNDLNTAKASYPYDVKEYEAAILAYESPNLEFLEFEEINSQVIYFDKHKSDIDPQFNSLLDTIRDFLRDNPGLRIEVIGYVSQDESKKRLKSLSSSRSRAVYNSLVERGVAKSQLKTVSSRLYDATKKNSKASGRRVEFKVITEDDTYTYQKVEIDTTTPDEEKDIVRTETYYLTELLELRGNKKIHNVYFRIQVGAFRNPLPAESEFLKVSDLIERELLGDGLTRYVAGNFETLLEAEVFKQQMRSAGMSDAFIVPYKNKSRTTMKHIYELMFQ